jgi:chromosomal replication initiator protein
MKLSKQNILDCVCKYFDVKEEEIKSLARTKNVVLAKRSYFYLCFQLTSFSEREISKFVNKDHSTANYHKKLAFSEIEYYKSFKKELDDLTNILKIEPSIIASNIDLVLMSENYTNSFIN